MPYVQVRVAGSLDTSQKKEIARGITKVLYDIAGKDPKTTYVVIEEVDPENWAVGGKLLSDS